MSGPTISDTDVILMVRRGKSDEFAKIMERYWPRVKGLIRKTIRSSEQIEDLCQETFLRAFNGLSQFDSTRQFGPWILKIAANVIGEYFRRTGKSVPLVPLDEELAHDAHLPEEIAVGRALIDHYLDRLPWNLRLLLILRHGLMLNYEEIAEILDEPVGTVKSNLFRTRAMLNARRERAENLNQAKEER